MANEAINAKMTALANEVRTLSGTTGKMGIEDMTTDIGAANIEITEQAVLIAQIITTIEDLPEASEGEIELPTLNNAGSASDLLEGKQLIDSTGNIVEGTIETFDGSYECSGESTGGSSEPQGVCPSVTITNLGFFDEDFSGSDAAHRCSLFFASHISDKQEIIDCVSTDGNEMQVSHSW